MNAKGASILWMAVCLPLLCLAAGCSGTGGDQPAGEQETQVAAVEPSQERSQVEEAAVLETVAIPDAVKPAVQAVLAQADAADGTVDHVVSKCVGCGLAMEGTAEHALKVGGDELHFCSEDCKHRFAGNAADALLALEIPKTVE